MSSCRMVPRRTAIRRSCLLLITTEGRTTTTQRLSISSSRCAKHCLRAAGFAVPSFRYEHPSFHQDRLGTNVRNAGNAQQSTQRWGCVSQGLIGIRAALSNLLVIHPLADTTTIKYFALGMSSCFFLIENLDPTLKESEIGCTTAFWSKYHVISRFTEAG
jgi:hypothetical protein